MVYICDFHREQAWERWLARSSNGLLDCKKIVLARLRAIARARSEEEYESATEKLKSSAQWITSSALRNWIEKTWLPKYKV